MRLPFFLQSALIARAAGNDFWFFKYSVAGHKLAGWVPFAQSSAIG
jgi:hypothetical protein